MRTNLLTGDEIVAIPLSRPERLFSGDRAALKHEWHALVSAWHPDRNPDSPGATDVLQHINALHNEAERKLDAGIWETAQLLRLQGRDGRSFELRLHQTDTFELGEVYIGTSVVAYALKGEARDIFDTGVAMLGRLEFADDAMRTEIAPRLAQVTAVLEAPTRLFLVLRKPRDQVLLRDLLAHQGGTLDPRHVAWIVGGLLDIACYLDWAGLMHGAIGPDTVFVSPRQHLVSLIGGWWYAAPVGARLAALPARSLQVLPPAVATTKVAAGAVDRELIRLTAREALGDPGGTRLLRDPSVPAALVHWLVEPPAASALDDYRSFEAARSAAFGRPRFVELAVDPEDIYPPWKENDNGTRTLGCRCLGDLFGRPHRRQGRQRNLHGTCHAEELRPGNDPLARVA